ncbi:hypothetical protein KVG88_06300 [Pseudomonas sp. SWRI74]|uniref:Lytic transglycosylase domain-containing protein n=1 Tax=Pseudomonas azerbaijanoccidentalis TaxID=2842347 RepID=A0ABS6QL42_9PSED|nr:hypothetical protein [Pseudomonas azerbaijanoccidentalis]MBV4519668.1 hypothetical protein [Pseudomonas azerbaijanoccidentalis]
MTEQEEFEFRMRLEQEQAVQSSGEPPAQTAQFQPQIAEHPQAALAPPDRLKERNWLERGTLGAGKAVADLMEGIGLGGVLWPRGWQRAPGADDDLMSDPAGIGGNIGGQIGLAYLGGRGLQAGGKAIQAASTARTIPALKTVGGLLETAGNAVINPANYKQAAGAGAAFGALSQPGDILDRSANSLTGAVGGSAGLAVGRGVGKVAGGVKALITPDAPIEMEVSAKLSQKGIDFSSLPQAVKDQVINIGKKSMEDVENLDATQLGRMADFNALGIKPTKGWLNRDPKQWWQENTLNTVDDQMQKRFVDANRSLLYGVRKGTGDATDYQRGQVLQKSVSDYDAGLKSKADSLYQAARNTAGRDIPLDPHKFVNDASVELDQQMLGSKLPADTLSWFQKATGGKEPFDMGTAMQRLQALNGRIYSTNDRAEAVALGIVKKHLINAIDAGESAPFNTAPGMRSPASTSGASSQPFTAAQIGGHPRPPGATRAASEGAMVPFQGGVGPATGVAEQAGEQTAPGIAEAFRAARSAAADRFRFQEASPLIEKILKGYYAPEDLPDIVGKMKVDQLKGLSQLERDRGVPIMSSLRDAAQTYIRDSATTQGETGGSFTINGMRKALDKIGPEKGRELFGKAGWADYQRILRTGGSIMNPPMKPAGSTTASNALRFIQAMPNIPGLNGLLNMTVTAAGKAKQMSDVGSALNPPLNIVVPRTPQPSLLPLITAPGLLGITEQ